MVVTVVEWVLWSVVEWVVVVGGGDNGSSCSCAG